MPPLTYYSTVSRLVVATKNNGNRAEEGEKQLRSHKFLFSFRPLFSCSSPPPQSPLFPNLIPAELHARTCAQDQLFRFQTKERHRTPLAASPRTLDSLGEGGLEGLSWRVGLEGWLGGGRSFPSAPGTQTRCSMVHGPLCVLQEEMNYIQSEEDAADTQSLFFPFLFSSSFSFS